MVGATGPLEVWFGGQRILRSESYQPLTPNTFALEVEGKAGENRLVLKVARTSQPLGACIGFKRSEGRHWHQSFYDAAIEWHSRPASGV